MSSPYTRVENDRLGNECGIHGDIQWITFEWICELCDKCWNMWMLWCFNIRWRLHTCFEGASYLVWRLLRLIHHLNKNVWSKFSSITVARIKIIIQCILFIPLFIRLFVHFITLKLMNNKNMNLLQFSMFLNGIKSINISDK